MLLIFKGLEHIADTGQDTQMKNLIDSPPICRSLLRYIESQNQEIRIKAIKVCSYLLSSTIEKVAPQFIQNGLLDIAYKVYKKHEEDTQTVYCIMNMLCNVAAGRDDDVFKFLNHEISGILLVYSNYKNQHTVIFLNI